MSSYSSNIDSLSQGYLLPELRTISLPPPPSLAIKRHLSSGFSVHHPRGPSTQN